MTLPNIIKFIVIVMSIYISTRLVISFIGILLGRDNNSPEKPVIGKFDEEELVSAEMCEPADADMAGVGDGAGVDIWDGGWTYVDDGAGTNADDNAGVGVKDGAGVDVKDGAGVGVKDGAGVGVKSGAGVGVKDNAGVGVKDGAGVDIENNAGVDVERCAGVDVERCAGVEVDGDSRAGVGEGVRADIWDGSWADIWDGGWAYASDDAGTGGEDNAGVGGEDSAWVNVEDSANVDAKSGAGVYVEGEAGVYTKDNAEINVKGDVRVDAESGADVNVEGDAGVYVEISGGVDVYGDAGVCAKDNAEIDVEDGARTDVESDAGIKVDGDARADVESGAWVVVEDNTGRSNNMAPLARIIVLAVITRLAICLFAYFFSVIFRGEFQGFFASYKSLWIQSDAPHYINIAENGYQSVGDDSVLLVFLPFYPMLIRTLAYIIHDYFLSGLVISLACFVLSCVMVYKVAILLGFDEEGAFLSAKYMILFPASFFVCSTFNESLFTFLSLACIYFMLKREWLYSALFGMLAAFTRYYGLLLMIPYAAELLQASMPDIRARVKSFGAMIIEGFSIILIPVGTAAYLLVNYMVAGNPFKFMEYQKDHWFQSFGLFYKNIEEMTKNALEWDPETVVTMFMPQLVMILCALLLILLGANRKYRFSMLSYSFVYFIISISPTWLLSFPRYIFSAVAIYPMMAILGRRNKSVDFLISFASMLALSFLTVAYTNGMRVF